MTITASAAVIAALFSTILTAIANQAHWDASRKRLVAGGFAILLGTAVAIASNQFGEAVPQTWADGAAKWIVIVGGVAAAAQAFFSQFKGILSAIEDATTLTPANTDAATDAGPVVADQPDDSSGEIAEG
jgi:hypothetical protein